MINLPFYSLLATKNKVLGLWKKNIFENDWKFWNDVFRTKLVFPWRACFALIVAFFSSGCRLMELFGGEQFGITEQSLLSLYLPNVSTSSWKYRIQCKLNEHLSQGGCLYPLRPNIFLSITFWLLGLWVF